MKKQYFLLLILISFLLNSITAYSTFADFETGRQAANRDDFATALREWIPLAIAGNSDAQYALGRMYARGDGVAKNFAEAKRLFTSAATQGHAKAQLKLATMLEYGDGGTRDYQAAADWYAKAAASGEPKAKERLEILLRRGIAPKDITALGVAEPPAIPAATPDQTPAETAAPAESATIDNGLVEPDAPLPLSRNAIEPSMTSEPSPEPTREERGHAPEGVEQQSEPSGTEDFRVAETPEESLHSAPLPTVTPDRELIEELME